jgi:hypothetical protein
VSRTVCIRRAGSVGDWFLALSLRLKILLGWMREEASLRSVSLSEAVASLKRILGNK